MSVTVLAVPVFLICSVVASTTRAVTRGVVGGIAEGQVMRELSELANTIPNQDIKMHISSNNFEQLLDKDFETVIMDKNLLIKTLEEHGARNIIEKEDDISCDCENFHFHFSRHAGDPYLMKISYKSEEGLENIVNDINTEYNANAQEISYNKIKERLEAQNLTINEEEIYDDNTIVLTVDLE